MSGDSRKLYFPAPEGLPVAVRPPRGGDATRAALEKGCRAPLVRAGALWLHGFVDEAHELAQDEASREGSYWHALVHRSEGDFDNSKYWFGCVGKHPIFPDLRAEVDALGPAPEELAGREWDPCRFVDLCARARAGRFKDLALAGRIAGIEYNLLMAHILTHSVLS